MRSISPEKLYANMQSEGSIDLVDVRSPGRVCLGSRRWCPVFAIRHVRRGCRGCFTPGNSHRPHLRHLPIRRALTSGVRPAGAERDRRRKRHGRYSRVVRGGPARGTNRRTRVHGARRGTQGGAPGRGGQHGAGVVLPTLVCVRGYWHLVGSARDRPWCVPLGVVWRRAQVAFADLRVQIASRG